MATPSLNLSSQDKTDLAEIRGKLPKDDPRRKKIDTLIGPEKSTSQKVLSGAEEVGGRALQTFASPVLHPKDTAKGMVMQIGTSPYDPRNPFYQRVEEFVTEPNRAKAWEDVAGDVLGMAAQGAALHELPRFKGAMTKTLEATRSGAQSMVGAGEKPIKTTVAKEAEGAAAGREKAVEASQKNTEATLEGQAKTKAARLKTLKDQREAQQSHAADVEQTKNENTEAVRKQKKISPTQEKLQTASRQLQARVETARENALKTGNEKYSGVNEALNHISADGEAVQSGLTDAAEKIKGSQVKGAEAHPRILEDLESRIQHGDGFTYEDLQGYYSELNRELSKGSLPGDVYAAYDTLHESIGNEMQRIADSQGQGQALTDARNYWRRMKQTFGKPYNPNDAANLTMEKASPEFARQEDQANRLRLLGSFDPEIPKVAENITNLRQGVSALGEPKPTREVVKPLPSAPETKTLPEYAEPKGSVPYERPEVNTRTIREGLLDRWTSGESQLSKFQVRSLIGGGFGALAGAILGHGEGGAIGFGVGTVFGPALISRLVDLPSVREWLTRPPAGELDTLQKLPNADRIKLIDGLRKTATQAQAKGVKVSPAILSVVGSAAGSATQQLQQTRQRQYDVQTGSIGNTP